MIGLNHESLKETLPYYLTLEQEKGLLAELKKIFNPDELGSFNYYGINCSSQKDLPSLMQGDVWLNVNLNSLGVLGFPKKDVNFIVLSNTCDISPDNKRSGIPKNASLAPLLSVSKFYEMLERVGVDRSKADSAVSEIKKHKVTDKFYLPPAPNLEESIVFFDQIITLPLSKIWTLPERYSRVSLALPGFYLFILKLSVHFCRLHENVSR